MGEQLIKFLACQEHDLTDLVESIDWGRTPINYWPVVEERDRKDRHDQFFACFSTQRAIDDLDWDIFIEAASLWTKRALTPEQLPRLVWRKLRRTRRYARLTVEDIRHRLMRLRV